MSIENEIKKQILEKFGKQYDLKEVDIKITISDRPPSPDELPDKNAILECLGSVGKYFVYAVKVGYLIVSFVCTLATIPDLPDKYNVYVPKAYEFVSEYAKQIFSGDKSAIRVEGKKEDGYLVLRQNWVDNPTMFKEDYSKYSNGQFDPFNFPDAAYIPASGSSGTIVNGTTSLIKFKIT
jgi:hypothetical protein